MPERMIRVSLSQEEFDEGPFVFNGTLDQVIESLLALRDGIPEEHREDAKCRIDASSWHDSTTASIEISYYRPETPEEAAEREKSERDRLEAERAKELALYEKLRNKFG